MAQNLKQIFRGTAFSDSPNADFLEQMYEGADDSAGGDNDVSMKADNTRTKPVTPRGTTDKPKKKWTQDELLKLLENVPKEKRGERQEIRLEGGQKLRISGDDMEVLDSNGTVQQMFSMSEHGSRLPSSRQRDSGGIDSGLMPGAKKGQGFGGGDGSSSGGDKSMPNGGGDNGGVNEALQELTSGSLKGDIYGNKTMESVYSDNIGIARSKAERAASPEALRALLNEANQSIQELEKNRKNFQGDAAKERYFMGKMNEFNALRDVAKNKLLGKKMGGN